MKLIEHPRGNYHQPETAEEQQFEYRGYVIEWTRAPVPPWAGVEWAAWLKDNEEDGSIHSSNVDDLKELIDEELEA